MKFLYVAMHIKHIKTIGLFAVKEGKLYFLLDERRIVEILEMAL